MSKKLRIDVQRETIGYISKNKSKFNSTIIKYANSEPTITKNMSLKANISVVSQDTLEATMNLMTITNSKVGFLVFANSTNPGDATSCIKVNIS